MSKKSAIVQTAQKYLQKGQIDRAIKAYQRALKLDPSDLRIRHKVGELHARNGDIAEALKELATVASGYADDSFFLKAVAVYKQMLKLRRDQFDVHVHLGELYRKLNLYSEAMQHFTFVASYYERNGRLTECMEVYEKIIILDDKDTSVKLKLADLASKLEEHDRALVLLLEINLELKTKNRKEGRVAVLERIVTIKPQDMAIQMELAEAYIEESELRKALGRLQVCFKVDPTEPATLDLLASVFHGLDQPEKSKAVLKELVRIYNSRKMEDRRQATLTRIQRIDPQDPDLLRWTHAGEAPEAPRKRPVQKKEVPETLGQVLYPDIPVKSRLAVLSAHGEEALGKSEGQMAAGDLDGAIRTLKQAVVREPKGFRLHDRLSRLLLLSGDMSGASKVTLMLVKLAVGARDVKPAQSAAAQALFLAPKDETVAMLASRLGVKASRAPQVPEWSDGTPYREGQRKRKAELEEAKRREQEAKHKKIPASEPAFDVDDGLVDDVYEDDDFEDDDGLVDDGLEHDADMFLDLGELDDDHEGELTSIHLDFEDESRTHLELPAIASKPQPQYAMPLEPPSEAPDDDWVDDDDGDEFDLAKELSGDSFSVSGPRGGASLLNSKIEMAKAYVEMGLFDEAITELENQHLNGDGFYFMGRSYREKGDAASAKDYFEQAIESGDIAVERQHDLLFELATVLESLGDDYRALEYYRGLFSKNRSYRSREVRGRIAAVTKRLAKS